MRINLEGFFTWKVVPVHIDHSLALTAIPKTPPILSPFTVPNVPKIGQDKILKLPDEKESWVSYSCYFFTVEKSYSARRLERKERKGKEEKEGGGGGVIWKTWTQGSRDKQLRPSPLSLFADPVNNSGDRISKYE